MYQNTFEKKNFRYSLIIIISVSSSSIRYGCEIETGMATLNANEARGIVLLNDHLSCHENAPTAACAAAIVEIIEGFAGGYTRPQNVKTKGEINPKRRAR